MNAAEIYAMDGYELESIGTLWGCYYNHLPEVGVSEYELPESAERMQVRVHAFVREDHRRFYRLASVWFDVSGEGDFQPVMVVTNAGREGDDHRHRWVTDYALLHDMVHYVNGLAVPRRREADDHSTFISADEERDEYITFYSGVNVWQPNTLQKVV